MHESVPVARKPETMSLRSSFPADADHDENGPLARLYSAIKARERGVLGRLWAYWSGCRNFGDAAVVK